MPKRTLQGDVFSKWLEQEVQNSVDRIIDLLCAERTGEYEGLPQNLVASIHNEVLWQVVVKINFPVNSLEPDQDIGEEFLRYEPYTGEKAHLFFYLCKLLAAWCPSDRVLEMSGMRLSHVSEGGDMNKH